MRDLIFESTPQFIVVPEQGDALRLANRFSGFSPQKPLKRLDDGSVSVNPLMNQGVDATSVEKCYELRSTLFKASAV